MLETRIEDESAIIELRNGIIHFFYKPEVIVDIHVQKKNIQNRIRIAAGKPRPIFADARNVKYWTKEARNFGMTEEGLYLASAFGIVHDSIISKAFINFLLPFFNKKVPMRFFTIPEEALNWLEQFK